MKKTAVLDIECYVNYFLVMLKDVESGSVVAFEKHEDSDEPDFTKLVRILRTYRIVTFNGRNYDLPMIFLALRRTPLADLKMASDAIILGNLRPWEFEDRFNVSVPDEIDHIDLIEVAPGKVSLKLYGGRLHSRKLQDLPIEPEARITPEQRELMREYCTNDLQTTIDKFKALGPQIALREQMTERYGVDLRSKSDAQIAEAVIKKEIERITGTRVGKTTVLPGTTFKYRVPPFIQYSTPVMKETLEMVRQSSFVVDGSGKVLMPKALEDARIAIGNSVYRMGIGGLHSSESCAAHVADGGYVLIDRDVTSYYPSIILNQGLAPIHLGGPFLKVYRSIVNQRIAAKRSGDKVVADSLKITINGSFGKFGSMYSTLYSPDLLIQTTVTGQLSLLMLIEMIECEGISVVSANTDGVVIKCPESRVDVLNRVIACWELLTDFETEETRYKALYSRDVNNYIALKEKGGSKTKGTYATPGIQKNPSNDICSEAVCAMLEHGTPIVETLQACRDIRKFVSVRTVRGGAVVRMADGSESYLGKVVRFYYGAKSSNSIHYKTNGNKVPRSDYAVPLMELPDEFPDDVFYAWYEDECNAILKDIGWRANA